ncbi:hypothetical protein SNK04_013979 [Fusarium graminearum]
MGLHTATDIARNAQRSFDGLLPAGTEVDSTALESPALCRLFWRTCWATRARPSGPRPLAF